MYVLDTNSIEVFSNYYPDRFPTFWENVEELVASDRLTSIRQVSQELKRRTADDHLLEWVDDHEGLFPAPSEPAMAMVRTIFAVPHFQQLIRQKDRLRAAPAADPWVIARAHVLGGCVVTEEKRKPNAAKIPNVCDHFDVDCCSVREMLNQEGWTF